MHAMPSSAAGLAWRSTASALYSSMLTIHLEEGRIPIPPSITHVAIEVSTPVLLAQALLVSSLLIKSYLWSAASAQVGCNGHSWQWNAPPPQGTNVSGLHPGVPIKHQKHVLLLAFEPILDKWASYYTVTNPSRYLWTQIETPRRPGWAVEDRLVVLPFAMHPDSHSLAKKRQISREAHRLHANKENATSEGHSMQAGVPFHVAASDGCSSILKQALQLDGRRLSGRRLSNSFLKKCSTLWYRTEVPAVSLQTVIEEWLGGRTISFIKIDAE
ncbi:MAG: hypothetical protein SGPRY_008259, partial [Prymnesium sp.]